MTDGSYAGLDDAAILEHLRRAGEGADESAGEEARHSQPDESQRAPIGAGMGLRMRLSTLRGHDEYPAELAGW